MSNPIYDLARERVAEGRLTVDAEAGVIYGKWGQPLKGKRNSWGYMQIGIRQGQRTVMPLAHIIIWESEHGPLPDGYQINHCNGIKTDNRISNLEMVTPSGNIVHSLHTGLRHRKLDPASVRVIRASAIRGERHVDIAARFGIDANTVGRVVRRERWAHVA